ncbi:MAG: hydrogenase maturation protease [Prochloraceae cyanobacterium]
MMKNILIIGYGNTLRGDDGAGQLVAREIAKKNHQNVKCLAVHQLTPELAEDISQASQVIFVDAVITNESKSQKITVKPIKKPIFAQISTGHVGYPRSLLSLTQALYSRIPPACSILIPAVNFEFGEELSLLTQTGIQEAIAAIEKLILDTKVTVTTNI